MRETSDLPVLYVREQRAHASTHILVRGPVYGSGYLRWLGGGEREVALLIGHSSQSYTARASLSHSLRIPLGDIEGFDVITDEHRFLRDTQNYSSVAISRDMIPDAILGAVVIPADAGARRYDRTLRIKMELDEPISPMLLDDIVSSPADERLVWRYEAKNDSGYLILRAATVLARGAQNADCIVIAERGDLEALTARADIYGFLRVTERSMEKNIRAERRLGKIICVVG